jgi:hypothetical protein
VHYEKVEMGWDAFPYENAFTLKKGGRGVGPLRGHLNWMLTMWVGSSVMDVGNVENKAQRRDKIVIRNKCFHSKKLKLFGLTVTSSFYAFRS